MIFDSRGRLMMLMSARFGRVAAESRLAKPPHSRARPRRPPYHLHAFCTAPARTLVAVLGDGSRLAGGNLWHGPAAACQCVLS